MLGHRPFAVFPQIVFCAETQIRFTLAEQALSLLAIDRQAIRLAIWTVGPTHIRAFIPVQSQPLQIVDELVLKAGLAALEVRILDAQHHHPALLPGEEPVE